MRCIVSYLSPKNCYILSAVYLNLTRHLNIKYKLFLIFFNFWMSTFFQTLMNNFNSNRSLQQSQPLQPQQPQQRQFAFGRSSNPSSGGPSSLRPGAPPTEWQTYEDVEFYRVGTSSYRVSVATIERAPYVSISHWWFNHAQAAWFPSRKQIFLPKSAWFGLLEQADQVSQVIQPLAEPPTFG